MLILELGFTFWKPIIWLIALAIMIVIAYLLRSRGQKQYKKDTDQTRIFLCGEEVPEAEQRHIRAHNIYWGFFEALKGYYDRLMKPHTGIVNDYMIWFVAIMAISTIIILITGEV